MATRGTAGRHIVGPRFRGDPVLASQLNTMSRRLDDVTREAFTSDLTIKKKRGGGIKTKWVKITNTNGTGKFGIANTSLKCKDLDIAGNPTGSEYDVFVISYGDTQGQIGMVPVANCWPPLGIGEVIEIEYKKQVPHGALGRLTDWFVRTERGRAGCS